MDEIDDFANDKEIQRIRKEEAAFKKMMEESIEIVKRRFQTEKGSHKNLKKFWMIRSLKVPIITESFKSLNPLYPFHYSIIRYSSSVPMGRYRNQVQIIIFLA